MLMMPRALCEEMLAHLRAHLPEEACGLLGGARGKVRRVYPVENAQHSPYAYSMEPKEQLEAMMAIENEGWEILAIFHSHPSGPSVPSTTDVAQAYYPESLYVIVAPDREREFRARAFEIVEERVREVELVIGNG